MPGLSLGIVLSRKPVAPNGETSWTYKQNKSD